MNLSLSPLVEKRGVKSNYFGKDLKNILLAGCKSNALNGKKKALNYFGNEKWFFKVITTILVFFKA